MNDAATPRRLGGGSGVPRIGLLLLASASLLLTAQQARAIGTTKCYFPSPGTGACVWGNLAPGDSGFAYWDGNGTEGGAMPANGGQNYSRRWRIIDSSGGHVAGWWTNALGNTITVTWSRRFWMNYQCNNTQATTISVYCRSDNVG